VSSRLSPRLAAGRLDGRQRGGELDGLVIEGEEWYIEMSPVMIKIVFSSHAKLQLTEREISEREVLETVRKPTNIIQQPNGRFQALKIKERKGEKYLLIVIYDERQSIKEIITAFYTSKIKKYLWNLIMIKK